MPKRFLILMVILLPHLVSGQWFMDTLICPHTKWQKDSVKFTSEDLKNSPFELFRLADSCARARDSADASEYFSRIDPYFLLYFNVNPNSLDSVFRSVSITGEARKRYRDEFKRAFDEPKTDLYDSFNTMAQVSGSIRFALWHYNVQDSSEFGISKMRVVDSSQFAFLYNYVREHGWPSLRDGALYAQAICKRDLLHHLYYLPIIKNEVMKGTVSPAVYYKVIEHLVNWEPNTEKLLNLKNKVLVDITPFIYDETPNIDTLNRIEREVSLHCPFRYVFYVFEGHNENELMTMWWNKKLMQSDLQFKNFETTYIFNDECKHPDTNTQLRFRETVTNSNKLYLLLLN